MKNQILKYILSGIAAALFMSPLMWACSDDSSLNTVLDNMQTAAERFPNAEQVGDLWLIRLNADRERYAADVTIENGDSVYFWFHLRTYSGFEQAGSTFWSNDPAFKASLAATGGDTTYWPVGPEKVRIGSTKLGLGLDATLPKLRQRDTAYVFVPYNKVGDDNSYGILPKETSVVWYLAIDSVIKN